MSAVDDLRTSFLNLHAHAVSLRAAADTAMATARGKYEVAERDSARRIHRASEQADAQASEAFEAAGAVVASRAERLAPGLAGRPFNDPAWRSGEWLGVPARYVRIGTVGLQEAVSSIDSENLLTVPALVPLLDTGNISLQGSPSTPWVDGLIKAVVLRTLVSAPPGRCEVTVFDPKLRGLLSVFARLRQGGNDLLSEALATADALEVRLTAARQGALRVAEMTGVQEANDLGHVRALTGSQTEPYRLFVLMDFPYGMNEHVIDELARLAHAGPRRGVNLLIHHDPSVKSPEGMKQRVHSVLSHTSQIVQGLRGVTISSLPNVEISCDSAPPRDLVEHVCGQLAEAALAGAAPLVELGGLLPTEHWANDSTDGVIATIGKAGLEPVTLELRGADPALPNVLVGGASGQGKSNLLLVMLHSMAAAYSPEDLHMYLLDYKDGLEFDRLGPSSTRPHWLPHAKVLGVEGDRLFGLAVLRTIEKEFRQRAERFRAGDAGSIATYRRLHPNEVIPRILLVIDEFQVLIAESDDIGRESISLLETLARRGRAVGIHLVLASQTLSGIETLASKERSIFGQFPWRISLKTEASESEAILGRGNTEASTLRYRGEAVLNSDYGALHANRRAVVAYADERQLDQLRAQLWVKAGPGDPPQVFYASRLANPDQRRAAVEKLSRSHAALLGLPVDVEPAPIVFPLSRDPGRTLAILGDGLDEALGVLSSAASSLAASRPGAEFVILDCLGQDHSDVSSKESLQVIADELLSAGCSVQLRREHEIGDTLVELAQRLEGRLAEMGESSVDDSPIRQPIYVIGVGLHRAARLDQISLSGSSPAHSLQRIVRDGPLCEMFLLGWWNSLRVFQEHLGYDVAPLVGGAMFLRAPESDVQAVCGPYVRYQAQTARGLFIDRGRGGAPIPVVPFQVPTPRHGEEDS